MNIVAALVIAAWAIAYFQAAQKRPVSMTVSLCAVLGSLVLAVAQLA